MKAESPVELILYYFMHIKPKKMVELGYSEVTVYRYKRLYEKRVIPKLEALSESIRPDRKPKPKPKIIQDKRGREWATEIKVEE